jgi:GAF domain-containing protein
MGEDILPTKASLEQLLRQQESLRQVIESISSELELRPLLTRIVRHACELIGADNGAIGLVDESRQVIRTEAVYHMVPAELGTEMPPGAGLAGHFVRAAMSGRRSLPISEGAAVRMPNGSTSCVSNTAHLRELAGTGRLADVVARVGDAAALYGPRLDRQSHQLRGLRAAATGTGRGRARAARGERHAQ